MGVLIVNKIVDDLEIIEFFIRAVFLSEIALNDLRELKVSAVNSRAPAGDSRCFVSNAVRALLLRTQVRHQDSLLLLICLQLPPLTSFLPDLVAVELRRAFILSVIFEYIFLSVCRRFVYLL